MTTLSMCCSGTIEEKIYHRQIFKHLLSKRILVDPRQSQKLSAKNLRDLFTLTEYDDGRYWRRVRFTVPHHATEMHAVCSGV